MKRICIVTTCSNGTLEYRFVMAPLSSPNIVYKVQ